jgi:hypothetical protein
MDNTAKQEIMKIIHDLEPEDAIQVARSIIDTFDARACIWVADDIDTVLDERHYEATFTDEERAAIKAHVTSSYEWRVLNDPTEENWESINSAVWQAALDHGIDLNRNDL